MRETSARLVGARAGETVCMNTLTVNLHLMMAAFYRPTSTRLKIVIEGSAFPSDSYAVASQAGFHGLDAEAAIVRLAPREGEHALRTDDVVAALERDGSSVALVLLAGVNYLTGELMGIAAITAATHAAGAVSGGTSPTRPETFRSSSMTGASTGRHGASSSTTLPPGNSPRWWPGSSSSCST